MNEAFHMVDFETATSPKKFSEKIKIYPKEIDLVKTDPLVELRKKLVERGPNFQNHLAQAIQGRPEDLDFFYEYLSGVYHNQVYELLSWVSYYFAKGDPNCANYQSWSGYLIQGSITAFERAREDLVKVLGRYKPERKPIHPELTKLLDEPYMVHFSATRIPKVIYNKEKKLFILKWPKNGLSKCVGVAPEIVKVSV